MSNVIRLSSARVQGETREELAGVTSPGAPSHWLSPLGTNVAPPSNEGESDRLGSLLHRREASQENHEKGQEEESMLDQLDRRDRLRLVEFVCSFAWADLEIQPEERVFIARLIRRLELDDEEDLQVQQWLDRPPMIDDLDPTAIPVAHRRVFVEAIEGLIEADGEVSEEERDSFDIFKQLLAD